MLSVPNFSIGSVQFPFFFWLTGHGCFWKLGGGKGCPRECLLLPEKSHEFYPIASHGCFQNLIFANTNVHSLQQINALTAVRSLDQLTIELDGNPVTKFTLWRLFTVYRLSHFNLKKINGVEVRRWRSLLALLAFL